MSTFPSPSPSSPSSPPSARSPRTAAAGAEAPANAASFRPPDTDGGTEAATAARLRAAGCVFAEEEARLLLAAAGSPEDLEALLARRIEGLPLEHVLGWAEFCGLRIAVEPRVFVPRRRTCFLVEQAAAQLRPAAVRSAAADRAAVVVDLCCGSGAVGAVLAARHAPVELHAADIDQAAVRCARRNLAGRGRVHQGDLYEPLPAALRGRVDVLVANAPYVPSEAVGLLPPEARCHEPRVALDGGGDGLGVLRRVAAGAAEWLAPGGCLLVEAGERQAARAAGIFARHGLEPRVAGSEELDATVVLGIRPAAIRPGAGIQAPA